MTSGGGEGGSGFKLIALSLQELVLSISFQHPCIFRVPAWGAKRPSKGLMALERIQVLGKLGPS